MVLYEQVGRELGELVDRKQKEYGDSVAKSAEILEILYPEGVPVYAYQKMLLIVRILDKLSRVSQQGKDGRDLGGESPFKDIAGYGLLGAIKDHDFDDLLAPKKKKVDNE